MYAFFQNITLVVHVILLVLFGILSFHVFRAIIGSAPIAPARRHPLTYVIAVVAALATFWLLNWVAGQAGLTTMETAKKIFPGVHLPQLPSGAWASSSTPSGATPPGAPPQQQPSQTVHTRYVINVEVWNEELDLQKPTGGWFEWIDLRSGDVHQSLAPRGGQLELIVEKGKKYEFYPVDYDVTNQKWVQKGPAEVVLFTGPDAISGQVPLVQLKYDEVFRDYPANP